MRDGKQLAWIAPRAWILTGLWVWALPIAFIWVWTGTQARLGWARGSVEALGTWAAILVARGIAAWVYDRAVAHWRPFTWQGDAHKILKVPAGPNRIPLLVGSAPFALSVGIMANVWGWTIIVPGRWAVFPLVLMAVVWLYAMGSLTLYNQVVVRWWGPLQWEQHGSEGSGLRLRGRQLFRLISLVSFLWIIFAVVVLWGLAAVLLTVLAHHFPAGLFGVQVGLFGAAFTLFLGYWTSVVMGLWYALGAGLYWWWQSRRGPVIWARTTDEVTS